MCTLSYICRGADLINMALINSVERRRKEEEIGLAKVKDKMERIKLRQERLHEQVALNQTDDHFVGL